MARYEFEASREFTTFEFESNGPNGTVRKRVQITFLEQMSRRGKTEPRIIYNLALGDVEIATNVMNDSVVTNNLGTEMVLATVAAIIFEFLNQYPSAIILFEGTNPARNRLYRMGISKYLGLAAVEFEVMGRRQGQWMKFQEGFEYDSFIIFK